MLGGLTGLVLGVLGAIVIDDAVFAWEPVKPSPAAAGSGASPSITIVPRLTRCTARSRRRGRFLPGGPFPRPRGFTSPRLRCHGAPSALLGRMDKGPCRPRTVSVERVRALPQKSPQFCCVAQTQPVLAHRQFVSQLVK